MELPESISLDEVLTNTLKLLGAILSYKMQLYAFPKTIRIYTLYLHINAIMYTSTAKGLRLQSSIAGRFANNNNNNHYLEH